MGQQESHEELEDHKGVRLHKMVQEQLKHSTKFGASDLQDLYVFFTSENPKGTIVRSNFILHNMKYTNFGDEEFWGHVFDLFDQDQNGEISFVEWVVLISLLQKGTIKEKIRWLFKVLDKDNSGYLSRNELEFVFSLIIGFYPEACDLKSPSEFTDELFSTLDGNHDDKLSLKEFVMGVKKFPVLYDSFLILSELVSGKLEIVQEDPQPAPPPSTTVISSPISPTVITVSSPPNGPHEDFRESVKTPPPILNLPGPSLSVPSGTKRIRTQSCKRHNSPPSHTGPVPAKVRSGSHLLLPSAASFPSPSEATQSPLSSAPASPGPSPSLIKRRLSANHITLGPLLTAGGERTLAVLGGRTSPTNSLPTSAPLPRKAEKEKEGEGSDSGKEEGGKEAGKEEEESKEAGKEEEGKEAGKEEESKEAGKEEELEGMADEKGD